MDFGIKRTRLKSYFKVSCREIEKEGSKTTVLINEDIVKEINNSALERAFMLSRMVSMSYKDYERNKINDKNLDKTVFFLINQTFEMIFKYFEKKEHIELNENKLTFNNEIYSKKDLEDEIKELIIKYFIRPVIDGEKIFEVSYITYYGEYKIELNLSDGFKLKRINMNKNILNNKYLVIKKMNINMIGDSYILYFKYKRKYVFTHFDKWYDSLVKKKIKLYRS